MQVTRRGTKRPQRRGFTLIELLVVISIIAVLAALILPGINGAREAARRMQCLNQMRNVSMAIQTYATSNDGALPPLVSATVGVWNNDGSGSPVSPVVYAPAPWSVVLLPYLEQSDLFDRITTGDTLDGTVDGVLASGDTEASLKATGIQVYTCPDDANADTGGTLSFAVNAGYTTLGNFQAAQTGAWNVGGHELGNYLFSFNNYAGPTLDTREVQAATGVFVEELNSGGYKATIDRMKDGQANTILLTENLQSEAWYSSNPRQVAIFAPIAGTALSGTPAQYTNARGAGADPNGIGPDPATVPPEQKASALELSLSPSPNLTGVGAKINENLGAGEGLAPRPSSNHPNVVNVMFADGHGETLTSDINDSVYLRLLSSNGGKFGQQVLSSNSF